MPAHAEPTLAIRPRVRTPVQAVAETRSGPVPATFAPYGRTASPPRPDLGHGTGRPTITAREPRRRRRPIPESAAPGTPPSPAPPKTAPAPPARAQSMPGRGSPPARGGCPSSSGRPVPPSQTRAAANPPTDTAAGQIVACHRHAEPAAARSRRSVCCRRNPAASTCSTASATGAAAASPATSRPAPCWQPPAFACSLLSTRHHPRARPGRRREQPVVRHQVLARLWHQRAQRPSCRR